MWKRRLRLAPECFPRHRRFSKDTLGRQGRCRAGQVGSNELSGSWQLGPHPDVQPNGNSCNRTAAHKVERSSDSCGLTSAFTRAGKRRKSDAAASCATGCQPVHRPSTTSMP